MADRRKPRYSGVLNQPIVRPVGLLFGPSSPVGHRYVVRARLAKLALLLAHYGIDAKEVEPWLKLAYRLALDHVPGMRVVNARPKTGAPRKGLVIEIKKFLPRLTQSCPRRKAG
jgi:hypothetical protein